MSQSELRNPRKQFAKVAVLILALIAVIAYFAERSFRYYFGYENHVKIEIKRPFIAAGGNSSFVVSADGNVYATGENESGQLGMGNKYHYKVFSLVSSLSGKNITALVANHNHSLALGADGKVYAAGNLDLRGRNNSEIFELVPSLSGKNIVAIAASYDRFLALGADGKVYAAGSNSLGARPPKIFALVSSLKDKNIVAIAAGAFHSFALDSDGKVYGASDYAADESFTLVSALNAKKIAAIVVDDLYSFVLDDDGKVYKASNNNVNRRKSFALVSSLSDKNITAIAANFGALALDANGKVYAAGSNFYGQLGLGNTKFNDTFAPVLSLSDKNITAIATGNRHSLALDSDGKVYAAGDNKYNQLGLDDAKGSQVFTLVLSLNDNNIVGQSANKPNSAAFDDEAKLPYAKERLNLARLGIERAYYENTFAFVPSLLNENIAAIATGKKRLLALDKNGKVYITSDNKYDRFGLDGESEISTLVDSLSDKNITQIAAGDTHSLALSGDGKVYAAGSNFYGQLGLGNTKFHDTFAPVLSLSDKNITVIAAGAFHSFALDSEGKLYATGYNLRGELGVGDRKNRYDFTLVSSLSDKNITAIAAGDHSFAIGGDGKLYAAGSNDFGQLGMGDETSRNAFTFIDSLSDKKIVAVAAGVLHSLAVDSDGKLYAVGNNLYGKLGLSDKTNRETFTLASSLSDKKIVAIAANGDHSLALTSEGKVYAAGDNAYAQLGLGDKDERKIFTLVSSLSDKKIVAIDAGDEYSLALDEDGKAYEAGKRSRCNLCDQ
ncbi:MAG: hypothetical protein LBO72_08315 [Helicobacteraceae bacterium]|jgi:alpha-tubulin suppressor-like RCC1 family protein|nr:hypothetical protein [Helicobacteraceae bacterium]